MASAARAEPVGAVGELRLVVRLQDQAQHFLQQLVRPSRQPQRTLLGRSFLVDREHLCPFALWTAFPSALAGRDPGDYYGHSVTIGLAPRRPSRIPLAP